MEQQSLTNPAPPTGEIPTEVPLGINSTTTDSPVPLNIVAETLTSFNYDYGIYLTKFTINNTMETGYKVFDWASLFPLAKNSNYYTISNTDFLRWNIPWQLILPFYSRMCKIEWEINFKPIKVGDCRVSIDLINTYGDYSPTTSLLSAKALANDSYHKNLDDTDDNLTIRPPMFFMTDNVATDSYRVSVSPGNFSVLQPSFLPSTNLSVFIRNPYVNNPIQPSSFEVLVTLRPIISNPVGIATKSYAYNEIIGVEEGISRPFFIRSPTN